MQSGFKDSTWRMQCDHKPTIRRKRDLISLATNWRLYLGVAAAVPRILLKTDYVAIDRRGSGRIVSKPYVGIMCRLPVTRPVS